MIKLSGSRFTDIMPENLAGQVEVQATAYAVGRQIKKLCAYSDAARTYAAIATMPEYLLDYMAVELRTPVLRRKLFHQDQAGADPGVPPVLYADGDAGGGEPDH